MFETSSNKKKKKKRKSKSRTTSSKSHKMKYIFKHLYYELHELKITDRKSPPEILCYVKICFMLDFIWYISCLPLFFPLRILTITSFINEMLPSLQLQSLFLFYALMLVASVAAEPMQVWWSYMFFTVHSFTRKCTFIMKILLNTFKSLSFLSRVSKVKLANIVDDNQKAPFSIATTLRCRGGHYSFLWITPLYPWYVPYIADC